MKPGIRKDLPWFLAKIGTTLICAAYVTGANAVDYRFGYSNSYHYPYGGFRANESFRLRREIDHLGDQVQRQQRQLDAQIRQQQEQTRLLRQQQSAQQQLTARQACYYRTNGGLDLCDRLFDARSKKHAACVETVSEMNPGCAEDVSMPAIRAVD